MHVRILGQASSRMHEAARQVINADFSSNEMLLFCDYSEFRIDIGHHFTAIKLSNGDRSVRKIILKAITQSFLLPFQEIPVGHKTICKFEFVDGIPACVSSLPKLDSWFSTSEFLFLEDDA